MADNDKRPLKLVRSLTPLQDDPRLQQSGQKLVDELQKDWDAKHPNGVEGMRRIFKAEDRKLYEADVPIEDTHGLHRHAFWTPMISHQ
jgi:hypothetical protein